MKKYIKYSSLSKEEKKKAMLKFNKSKKGNELNTIYFRLLIEGVVSVLVGVGLSVYAFATGASFWYYLIGIILIVFSVILFVAEFTLKRKVVERMLNN